MLKLLDKEKTHVIVKMDIFTYEQIKKKSNFDDLIEEARNSKWYSTHEELMTELNS